MPVFEPPPAPLAFDPRVLQVVRYKRLYPDEEMFEYLPNVICVQIDFAYGSEPPRARFEYVLDDHIKEDDDDNPDTPPVPRWPSQFDELWPLTADGKFVLKTDDELCVFEVGPKNQLTCVFNGFAQIPQVDMTSGNQVVTFVATGTPIRCFDKPISETWWRHNNSNQTGPAIRTNLLCRPNPDGKPNCTPVGYDVNEGSVDIESPPHPVFLDVLLKEKDDQRTYWTLNRFIRYILAKHNVPAIHPQDPFGVEEIQWVDNPDFTAIDDILNSRRPKEGSDTYDPTDPDTYDEELITLNDFVATGMAWPQVVDSLLTQYGFLMRWQLDQEDNNRPWWSLVIDRTDVSGDEMAKDIYLPKTGETQLTKPSNLAAIHVARDQEKTANQIRVDPGPDLYEVSIVLAPGFEIDPDDNLIANRSKFLQANRANASAEERRKYRDYVADEDGSGHWVYLTSEIGYVALDLSSILGGEDGDGNLKHVRRRRPSRSTLLTKDEFQQPVSVDLSISTNYEGPVPALWDSTGTWRSLGPPGSNWVLLKDRFGIRCVADDPNAWHIPKEFNVNPGNVIRGIQSQAAPTAQSPRFYLRLTGVIEGDRIGYGVSKRRFVSPTPFTNERLVDSRDDFHREIITEDSLYRLGGAELIERDDTAKAEAYADSLRSRHEFPPFAGSILIPWMSFGYDIGDRIRKIVGRDVDMRCNGGNGADEAPRYPVIVSRSWIIGKNGQTTQLQIEDRRAEVRLPNQRVPNFRGGQAPVEKAPVFRGGLLDE